MDKFLTDFDYFWSMINNNENFSFARYADGEVMLMKGQNVNELTQAYTTDKWSAPNGLTKVGAQLIGTLNHVEDNFYYAISAPNDNIHDYLFLKDRIKQKNEKISFVNLWINANYLRSLKKYTSLKRDVILICNENAKKENFPFNVISIHPFPNDCINFWENNADDFINNLINKFKNVNNQLVFISCGPVSEIIIHILYSINQNNTYIDVGSSIDEFVHGKKTRPYMQHNSQYSNYISKF